MKFGIPALALLATLSLFATPAAATGAQNWYLKWDETLEAHRGSFPGSTEPDVLVADGETRTWWANEPAAIDVAFGSGDFTVYIKHGRDCVDSWFVTIGYGTVGAGGYAVPGFASDPQSGCMAGTTSVISIPVTDFTVPEGQTLGFQVSNALDGGVGAKKVEVVTDGSSYFQSTSMDPGYPTPELGTVALVGAGVGVVGIAVLRRK